MSISSYAVVFPGQGSQSIGMLGDLSKQHPQIEQTFKEVSDSIGIDIWDITQNGPQEKIDSTIYTQPIMLAADVALWRVWQQSINGSPKISFLAGHSLGEYSALVCAESLTLKDASLLVQKRAQLMQQATKPGEGAMAAILGLDDSTVENLCNQYAQNEVLSPANFNSIGQCVVAGHSAAIDRVIVAAKDAGAKIAKKIPVSVPSHCALMSPAIEPFTKALAEVNILPPKTPVVQNVDVNIHESSDEIKQALVKQLTHSVRWVETIQYLSRNNINKLIECGPGQVLSKLNKRIDKTMDVFCLNSEPSLQKTIAELQTI